MRDILFFSVLGAFGFFSLAVSVWANWAYRHDRLKLKISVLVMSILLFPIVPLVWALEDERKHATAISIAYSALIWFLIVFTRI